MLILSRELGRFRRRVEHPPATNTSRPLTVFFDRAQCPKSGENWSIAGSSAMFVTTLAERDEARISGTNGLNHPTEACF